MEGSLKRARFGGSSGDEYRDAIARQLVKEERSHADSTFDSKLLILTSNVGCEVDGDNNHPVWKLQNPLRIKTIAFNQAILPISIVTVAEYVTCRIEVVNPSPPPLFFRQWAIPPGFWNTDLIVNNFSENLDQLFTEYSGDTWGPGLEYRVVANVSRTGWFTRISPGTSGPPYTYTIPTWRVTITCPDPDALYNYLVIGGLVPDDSIITPGFPPYTPRSSTMISFEIRNSGNTTDNNVALLIMPKAYDANPEWIDLCSDSLHLAPGVVQTGTARNIITRVPWTALINQGGTINNRSAAPMLSVQSPDMTYIRSTTESVQRRIDFYWTDDQGQVIDWAGRAWSVTMVVEASTE